MENNQQNTPMIKPDSNLVWAILTTLICCLPFGVVAIVKACKVDSLWANGQCLRCLSCDDIAITEIGNY